MMTLLSLSLSLSQDRLWVGGLQIDFGWLQIGLGCFKFQVVGCWWARGHGFCSSWTAIGLGFDGYGFLSHSSLPLSLSSISLSYLHLPLSSVVISLISAFFPSLVMGFLWVWIYGFLWVSWWILCVWISVFVSIFGDGSGGVYVAVVVVAMPFVVVGCGSDLVFVLFFYLSLWV